MHSKRQKKEEKKLYRENACDAFYVEIDCEHEVFLSICIANVANFTNCTSLERLGLSSVFIIFAIVFSCLYSLLIFHLILNMSS